MSLVYPDPNQGQYSPLEKSFAYKLMSYDPAAVVLQVNLRDYFAAAALQGIMSSTQTGHSMIIAKDAYGMADAMLKAREVKP